MATFYDGLWKYGYHLLERKVASPTTDLKKYSYLLTQCISTNYIHSNT